MNDLRIFMKFFLESLDQVFLPRVLWALHKDMKKDPHKYYTIYTNII